MLLVAMAAGALVTAVIAVLRPELPTRLPAVAVWLGAAIGAVAVGIADTAPTGSGAVDLVLRVAFGALVPLAASRAGSLTTCWLLVVSAATMLIAVDAPGGSAAALLAGSFLALTAAGAARPAAASIAAGANVGALAHIDWPVVTGASAAAVAVAVVPVLLLGLARTERPWRGRAVVAVAVVGTFLGIAAVGGLVAALGARTDVDRAVEFATSGIDRLGDDDERARADLLDAAGAFDSAQDDLTVWWARPALLVPGVAQQSRAVTTMASAGADLARTAADATEEADVDSVRPRSGRVDLDALAALQEPLQRSLASLRDADARLDGVETPLLLGPLADRLDTLRTEVTDALGSAELAAQAVEVAPQLLGADGPRRYFIAFQNPAESTGNGGFMGSWAELVTDDGQLTLTRTGRSRELTLGGPDPFARTIEGEPEFIDTYTDSAARAWGNINFVPDHPTVGRIVAQLYPESGGAELDGVIAITPAAMAGFLELTGPIDVPGYPERLDSGNVERILLHEQYLTFPQASGDDRENFLGDAVEVLFDQLTSGELPGPRVIADELGPAVSARDLQMWSTEPAEQALFRRIGATGEGTATEGIADFGVISQNLNGNKIDWFLEREISYSETWAPESGEVDGTLEVRFRNGAPSAGLPASVIGWGGDPGTGQRPVEDGENFMWVFLYAPHPITEVTVDGEPTGGISYQQLGHHAFRLYVSVPPEGVRDVVARTRGVVEPQATRTLRAMRQPMANPDTVQISLEADTDLCLGSPDASEVDDDAKRVLTREDATTTVQLTAVVDRCDTAGGMLDRLRSGS